LTTRFDDEGTAVPKPLNIKVNGSSVMCVEAADWMSTFEPAARNASESFARGLDVAESTWNGPAFLAFRDAIGGVGPGTDDLAHTAGLYANALLNFASTLDKAKESIDNAVDKAISGGLVVTEDSILPPITTGWIAERPMTLEELREYPILSELDRQYVDERIRQLCSNEPSGHQIAVIEHNRKIDVFNECKAIICEAREKEEEAHKELHQVLVPKDQDDDWAELADGPLGDTTSAAPVIGESVDPRHKSAWQRAGVVYDIGVEFALVAAGRQPWTVATAKVTSSLTAGAVISRIFNLVPIPQLKILQVTKGLVQWFASGFIGGKTGEAVEGFFLPEREGPCSEPDMEKLPLPD
jgi:hypothetical protein